MDNNPEVEHPKRRSDVIFRPLDDSWVLFDPGTEQVKGYAVQADYEGFHPMYPNPRKRSKISNPLLPGLIHLMTVN